MNFQSKAMIAIVALICLVPVAAFATISDFSQNFEGLNAADMAALGDDGWVVYGTVFDGDSGNWLYGYGTNPAPNNPAAPAFSNIVVGEGGVEQGSQQLSVFSDYENGDHAAGHLIVSSFFKEFNVTAADVGKVCTFSFQAKMGTLVAPSTAMAWIKTLDPSAGYSTSAEDSKDMTATPADWDGSSLTLTIDASQIGHIFQVGFSNDCALYAGSSIIYDNLVLTTDGGSGPNGMVAYSQDFEALNAADVDALGDDDWLIFANVFDAVTGEFAYGYGPFSAPNNPSAPAFCTIVTGEGGDEQGVQQISVFSDYENADAQTNGDLIEANVFQEQIIGPDDIGKTWVFEFQAKMPANGGVIPPATALAFVKTIDPNSNFDMTNFVSVDMSNINSEWSGYSLSLAIDAGLVGQFFQFGFSSSATGYHPSAIIYDNVILSEDDVTAVPNNTALLGAELGQNYPNPFNPMTRIDFSLDKPGFVSLAVYDIAGRLVTNLVSENMSAGDHFVTWNGTNRNGSSASSGQYVYVMKTANGMVARNMVLLK
ncbi:MAG: T9SS type A sorting domain-containing protein [bacterium]|nr:T9SS type A sorting domain-containing protein [bacterium]